MLDRICSFQISNQIYVKICLKSNCYLRFWHLKNFNIGILPTKMNETDTETDSNWGLVEEFNYFWHKWLRICIVFGSGGGGEIRTVR